ncbi:hypothetical protein FACS189491_07510 [Spirochaetia bacterium]|nr:hypothetical protein FACS189491_07510 [Spirochaetia bacterium]
MKTLIYLVCAQALMLGLLGCTTTSSFDLSQFNKNKFNAVVNVFVLADPVTPETTCFLYVGDNRVIEFDGERRSYPRDGGVIIPSGMHTIVFVETGESLSGNFIPGYLYYIKSDNSISELPGNGNYFSAILPNLKRAVAYCTRIDSARQQAVPHILPRALQSLMGTLNNADTIAIVGVTYGSHELSQYVADELEYTLMDNNFILVDRGTLDKIRQEQHLQLSGEVDDATAVSIGKFVGAKTVIVGTITGRGDIARLHLRALNTETAQVVGSAMEPLDPKQSGKIQGALQASAQTLMQSLSRQDTIAIVGSTNDQDITRYIADGLETELVNNQYIVVDRSSLDKIRQEQRFQLSGDVDDSTAVSIGKFAGAKVVIVVESTGSGDLRRLRLRALQTETARVIGVAAGG